MATRTKPATTKSRAATTSKRSTEVATAKAGERTCAPGRTVGEAKTENESPQRTSKAASVANAANGQTLSEPKRAQPSARPTPDSSSSNPAPSVPAAAKAPSPAVSSASSPVVKPKRKESESKPELCRNFLAGRSCAKSVCSYRHESTSHSEATKQVPIPPETDHPSPSPTINTASNPKALPPMLSESTERGKKRRLQPCKRYIQGRCHDENCPKKHPRKYDPERATNASTVGLGGNEGAKDEPNASVPLKEVPKVTVPTQSSVATLATPSPRAPVLAKPQPSAYTQSSSNTSPTPVSSRPATSSPGKPAAVPDAQRPVGSVKARVVPPNCDPSICRNYLRGRCHLRKCRYQHIDLSETRGVAAQSEQQRQQSPAVDAVDSVATESPLSVPSGSGNSAAEPKNTNPSHSPAASLPLASSKSPNQADASAPEIRAAPQAVEESKGIGDAPTRENGVCRFFVTGQCIAARCRLSHELPQSTPPRPSSVVEVPFSAKNSGTTTSSLFHAKAGLSKLPDLVEPWPLSHLPFSDVADLGTEATPSTQRTNNRPPRPSGLPPKSEPLQDRQPVRGWLPDPRPARWFDKICWRYREGHCPRGDNCHLTHTLAIDNRRAKKDWEVCRLYLIGACDYGDRCRRTHISADSPTLTLPKQQSDSAPRSADEVQSIDGNGLKPGMCDGQTEGDVDIHCSDAERVRTHPRSVEKSREDRSVISNEVEEKITTAEHGRDQSGTRTDSACSWTNVFDDRPDRRLPDICGSYLVGRCKYGDKCHWTHPAPDSQYSQPTCREGQAPEASSSRLRAPATIDACDPRTPTPLSGSRDICLNWLVRGNCLNGTSCAYEHSIRGALSAPQHVAESSGSVTPMPTGSTNHNGYVPSQSRQLEPRGSRDYTAEPHTLYRTPGPPQAPLVNDSGPVVPPQDTTAGYLLNLINGPAHSSQLLSSSRRQSDHASTVETPWREPVIRSAQRAYKTQTSDLSRCSVPRNPAKIGLLNVGPRLWPSRPDFEEDRPWVEQSQDTRDTIAFDRGEGSSDSSFHSAEDFSDASIDTAPSTASSLDSSPVPVKPQLRICWYYTHGKCYRPRCSYLHQRPPDRQSIDRAPPCRPQADVTPAVKSTPQSAIASNAHVAGVPARASEKQRLGDAHHPTATHQTTSTQAPAVPLVPPGLGLETKRPSLAPPPVIPRKEPPASMTLTVLDSTKVTYGPGFDVQSIATAFETRQVVLKDLPRGISTAEVSKALKSYGEITSIFLPDPGKKGVAGAKVTFATPEQAASAACALDGLELFGTTISARLWSGQTSLVGRARLADGDVLFEFPCAHKTAYVGYSTRAQADKAISLANESEVKGNWVVAELHEGLPSAGAVTVRFRGLPASTQMKDLMRYGKAEGFMVERPNYESTKAAIHRLRVILEKFGHEFLFNLLPPPYKRGNVRAYAHFETAEAAEIVCAALNNRRQPFCGYGKLSATHISTLVYQLPPMVFNALAYDIRLLNDFVWRTFEPGSSISIIDNRAIRGPQSPVSIKLAAQRYQALTKMKALFDRLLHGERIEQGGEIVWDTFFARRAGIFYLEDLQRRHTGVLINRDARKGILSLFGPEPLRRAVHAAILAKVGDLRSRKWYSVDLPGRLIGLFWGSDLATLQRRFGEENVTLDTAARTLRVRGDDAAHEAALLAVKQARERHADEKCQPQVECPVCFTEVTNPVKLDCGHTWCKSCLQNYLRASIDNASFPLVCLGDEARCPSRIPIHVAQEVLSTNDFNDILEAAFRAHVHSHPKEYHYCPTPDCKQVYHRNTQNHALQCPSCLLRICPKCNAEYHEQSPCQGDEESDRALFEEWKRSHDVKDCPGCKAPIEREAGCNHMTCVRCKTHICWVCLATFEESGEVYAHMHSIHGGIGLEEV